MRSFNELNSGYRLYGIRNISPKYQIYSGMVEFPSGLKASVIFGFKEADGKMEHVSVSPVNPRHVCTWEEMCWIKDLFFKPDEMCVQVHPREDRYIHGVGSGSRRTENVLHIWRPADGDFSILNHPEDWD